MKIEATNQELDIIGDLTHQLLKTNFLTDRQREVINNLKEAVLEALV